MDRLKLEELPIAGKKVLMRVDFNVPIEEGVIRDDSRIVAALPSIHYILNNGGAIILMSHLGRPKGCVDKKLSLLPCANHLKEKFFLPVQMAADTTGDDAKTKAQALEAGQILMLENVRFHPGEEDPKGNPDFVKALASLGDVYVNDAFGTAHRYHASTAAIASHFPETAAAGLLMQKEVKFLGELLNVPKKPFYALIGGAKISTKIGTLSALIKKADAIMIGGAMAHTFLKAKGVALGNSLYEDDLVDKASELLEFAHKQKVDLLLPSDLIIADHIDKGAKTKVISCHEGVPDGWQAVDIGPVTLQMYKDKLQKAKTVFWNGPMGIFEVAPFAKGTLDIAYAIANLEAVTIVGGGDSIAAVHDANVDDKISHLSTGGGASLEYIEYGTLPGIEALSIKK